MKTKKTKIDKLETVLKAITLGFLITTVISQIVYITIEITKF